MYTLGGRYSGMPKYYFILSPLQVISNTVGVVESRDCLFRSLEFPKADEHRVLDLDLEPDLLPEYGRSSAGDSYLLRPRDPLRVCALLE